jgi:hypothetical protein
MTTIVETIGVVRSDGTLELPQKLAVPPGRAKVRVETVEAETDAKFAARFERLATMRTARNTCTPPGNSKAGSGRANRA